MARKLVRIAASRGQDRRDAHQAGPLQQDPAIPHWYTPVHDQGQGSLHLLGPCPCRGRGRDHCLHPCGHQHHLHGPWGRGHSHPLHGHLHPCHPCVAQCHRGRSCIGRRNGSRPATTCVPTAKIKDQCLPQNWTRDIWFPCRMSFDHQGHVLDYVFGEATSRKAALPGAKPGLGILRGSSEATATVCTALCVTRECCVHGASLDVDPC